MHCRRVQSYSTKLPFLSSKWTHYYETLWSSTVDHLQKIQNRLNLVLSCSLLTRSVDNLLKTETDFRRNHQNGFHHGSLEYHHRSRNIRLQYIYKMWYVLFPLKKLTTWLWITLNDLRIQARTFRWSSAVVLADPFLKLRSPTATDAARRFICPLTPRCWNDIVRLVNKLIFHLRQACVLHFCFHTYSFSKSKRHWNIPRR